MENDKQTLKIRITKTESVDIDNLEPFQGNLKTLSEESYNKLRKVLIDEGFCFAMHVWQSGDIIYILDGHQRISVMSMMRKSGYTIPPVTCNFISARTFQEAKKLVLLAVSQYGRVDKKGLQDFVGDDEFEIGDFDLPGDGDDSIWDFDADPEMIDPADAFSALDGGEPEDVQITFVFSRQQKGYVEEIINDNKAKGENLPTNEKGNNANGNTLYAIIKEWRE